MSVRDNESAPRGRGYPIAFWLLSAGVLMVVVDTTIVTVALPSIAMVLGIRTGSLSWLLNAYMLTFGGFLILSGRLGDLYGTRRVFLLGIAMFALASLFCGFAHSEQSLLIGRAWQGLGGAMITAVSLSLLVKLFPDETKRAGAMGIYGAICAAAGGLGEVLGGVLTKALSWHWIFLVNVPIGACVYLLSSRCLPGDCLPARSPHLDVGGTATLTAASTLLIYVVVASNSDQLTAVRTWSLLGIAIALFAAFVLIEIRVAEPLVPLRLFRIPAFTEANILAVLWSASMFAWFVIVALYLQRVLGYDSLEVGLAFMPAEIVITAFSAGLSGRMIGRFGVHKPLAIGFGVAAVGLSVFAREPLVSSFVRDVLPGMVLLGCAAGMVSNALLLKGMNSVGDADSGLASGVLNTSFMMGGAVGLAILSTVAAARTNHLLGTGASSVASENAGYQLAFAICALLSACAAALIAWRALTSTRGLEKEDAVSPTIANAISKGAR